MQLPYANKIPWSEPIAEAPPPELRDRLARSWRYRMWNESGASSAFRALADLCERTGTPEYLLAEMRESAEDEVRHAETCRGMIARFTGEADPTPPDPFPRLPLDKYATDEERALAGVVLMSCISETVGCPFQREIADAATDPVVQAAQEIFYAEELRHGRFGWTYLAFDAKRAPDRVARFAAAIPGLIQAYARGLGDPQDRSAELEGYGILGPRRTQRIFREALHRLILPGFKEFGLDVSGVEKQYPLLPDAG